MPFVPDAQPAAPTGRFVPDAPAAPPHYSEVGPIPESPPLLDTVAHAAAAGHLANPVNAMVGIGESALSGITGGAQRTFERMRGVPVTGDEGYQPRTEAGKGIATIAGAVGNKVSDAYDAAFGTEPSASTFKTDVGKVADLTAVAGPAEGLLRGALTEGAAGATAGAARDVVPGGPPNPINEVHAAGYQFRPSDVQARNPSMQSVPGSLRESITSSPEQTQQIVRNNSALSTKLIGEDIGVPNATKLTPQHYAQARLAPGADYDRVGAAVGPVENVAPATTEALDSMANDQSVNAMPAAARTQAARISAGLQAGKYPASQVIQDISYFRTVPGGRAAAAALEDELGAQVASKAPELSGTYENARTTFAKIQNAEDATTGGLIDAADYRRLAEGNPRLLTGNSRLVALAGGEIPTVTALPRATADMSPVKGTLYDTVANAAARATSKVPGMNITNPGLQAKIAAAAPDTGPLPMGPHRRGLGTSLAGGPALPGDNAE